MIAQVEKSIGNGIYEFDCLLWNNKLQKSLPMILKVNVPSLTALNNLLRDEGKGDYCVSAWKLV